MLMKRGQVSISVIVAVVIVAVVLGYFLLKGRIMTRETPASLQPAENYFLSCIEGEAEAGIEILGAKGGYIYVPEFFPGSDYMPFSNQLNFLGDNIPYWYYVSGNNLIKEQVPSKNEMERQLERYLEENLDCDFSEFKEKGFEIDFSDFSADVNIFDVNVDVAVRGDLDMGFGDDNVRISNHKAKVNSKLGKFYSEALKIYNYEKQNSFLENYAIDVLRLYLPVDGVEISCSPKIWLKNEADNDLKQALEGNLQAVKFSTAGENEYFVQNLDIKEEVNIMYDRNFPTKIEVWDSSNNIMIAEPVGNQPGLGILGFCYVPYHFVYDIAFPSLIQIYDLNEMFQFPVSVVIDKNNARNSVSSGILNSESELCKYTNKEVNVYTYNNELEGIEADISFDCLGQRCDIGKTEKQGGDALLIGKFPQCLNGFILAKSEGYAEKRYGFSSNEEIEANIILDKLYDLDLQLEVNNQESSDIAVINFVSEDTVQTVAWPEMKQVKLSEGFYNISVFVYKSSGINLPPMKKEVCNIVPREGVLGIFGMTEEKCFDVDIPGEELSNVIAGGGKSSDYFIENQLKKGEIIVGVSSIPVPSSLEQLQDAYNIIEIKPVYIDFK